MLGIQKLADRCEVLIVASTYKDYGFCAVTPCSLHISTLLIDWFANGFETSRSRCT